MRRLQSVLLAAVAVIGFASIASSADMPVKAPAYKAPIAAPFYNWTGFYIGGNVGGVNEQASGTSDFTDTEFTGTGIPLASNPQSNSFSNTRFIGGLQVGYNWQFDPHWVLGVEADWDWTRTGYDFCRQTNIDSTACSDNGSGFETVSSQTKWLATARGRLGVTWDKFLFYGTGGAAWGRVDTTLGLNCPGGCGDSTLAVSATSTTSTTKAGWVAGLGVEAMLTGNWTARAEWLHIDLGTISASLVSAASAGNTQTASWSRTERFDEFRVGLNYRFGGIGLLH